LPRLKHALLYFFCTHTNIPTLHKINSALELKRLDTELRQGRPEAVAMVIDVTKKIVESNFNYNFAD